LLSFGGAPSFAALYTRAPALHTELQVGPSVSKFAGVGQEVSKRFYSLIGIDIGLRRSASSSGTQVTLDVSKITCDQYTGYKITNTQNIAIWLSGYYHGKRGDTTLETQGLVANAKKLRSYCFRNPETLVTTER
jgi:hypothetical protein